MPALVTSLGPTHSLSTLLQVLPNVLIEEMGYKMGLNGVDNAKLTFDNVRVPR